MRFRVGLGTAQQNVNAFPEDMAVQAKKSVFLAR
jgi:hypothetical protein